MIALSLCHNRIEDAKIAFQWRNDAKTIASSYIRLPKSWDSFWLEFSECYFEVDELAPVFVVEGNVFVGFVRFEKTKVIDSVEAIEVMINIAPDYRGAGIGTEAVFLVKDYLYTKGFRTLAADIRSDNKPSLVVFKKAGFRFESQREEYIAKTKEKCSIVRMVCLL